MKSEPREHRERPELRRARNGVQDPGDHLEEPGARDLADVRTEVEAAVVRGQVLAERVVLLGVADTDVRDVGEVVAAERAQHLGAECRHHEPELLRVTVLPRDPSRERNREQRQQRKLEDEPEEVERAREEHRPDHDHPDRCEDQHERLRPLRGLAQDVAAGLGRGRNRGRFGPAHRVLRVVLNARQARPHPALVRAVPPGQVLRDRRSTSARMYATFSGTVRTAESPAATWVAYVRDSEVYARNARVWKRSA